MNFFGRDLQGYPKALVILVAILLVSSGLCGVQLAFAGKIYNSQGLSGSLLMVLGLLELLVMALSVIGIGIVLIAWLIAFLVGGKVPNDNAEGNFYVTSQGGDPKEIASVEPKEKH
jgi:hypothetical protein